MSRIAERARCLFKQIAAIALAISVSSCDGEDTQSHARKPVETTVTTALPEERVADDAVFPMDREGFSDTYAKLGPAQFERANDLAHWAAVAAAEHGGICDQVAMVNVSDSSTREQIIWFADCENKQRIMIDQRQAEDAKRRFGDAS